MAEPSGAAGVPRSPLLQRLSRILPNEFVDRVAQPALDDEFSRWTRNGRVPPLGRTRFVCSCLLVGMPQVFWARRRPTGIAMVLAASALVAFIAFMLWMPTMYDTPTP